jgi:hypothetical protein
MRRVTQLANRSRCAGLSGVSPWLIQRPSLQPLASRTNTRASTVSI